MNIESSLLSYQNKKVSERVSYLEKIIEDIALDEEFMLKATAWETSPLPKWYLIKGLGAKRSVRGIPLIIDTIKQGDTDFGDTSLYLIAASSLGQIGQAALGEVVKLLESPDTEIRQCAVDAIGEIGDASAIEVLCSLLEKDEFEIQIWAGLSLSKIGKTAIPHMLETFQKDNLPNARITRLLVIDSVIKIEKGKSGASIEKLFPPLNDEEKKFLRKKAL